MTLEDVFIDLTNRGRKNLWLKFFCLSGSKNPVVVNGRRILAKYEGKYIGWEISDRADEYFEGDKDWPIKDLKSFVYYPLDARMAKYLDLFPWFP